MDDRTPGESGLEVCSECVCVCVCVCSKCGCTVLDIELYVVASGER